MSFLVLTRMPQVLFCKAACQQLDPSIYWCMGLYLPAAGLCPSLCWTAQCCSWLMAPACQGPSQQKQNPLVSQPLLDPADVSPSLMLHWWLPLNLSTWWQVFHMHASCMKGSHLSLPQDREQLGHFQQLHPCRVAFPVWSSVWAKVSALRDRYSKAWRMHPVAHCHHT